MRDLRRRLITNLPVITEVVHMLGFAPQAQRDFLFWGEQALTIDADTTEDFPRIRALLEKYRDLPADFTDASLIALCERLKITSVASVDKDFTIPDLQNFPALRFRSGHEGVPNNLHRIPERHGGCSLPRVEREHGTCTDRNIRVDSRDSELKQEMSTAPST